MTLRARARPSASTRVCHASLVLALSLICGRQFVAASSSGLEEGCTWVDPSTQKRYDISTLTKTMKNDDYTFKSDQFTFKANICGRATSECNSPNVPPATTPVAFQYASGSVMGEMCTASLGDLMSSPLWSTFRKQDGTYGFQVLYTGGSGGCSPPAPPTRSVTYKFICDRHERNTASLSHAAEDVPCSYTLEFRTSLACKGHHKFSATGFIMFLIVFTLFIYCFIEVTDNIQKGATGLEVIPHKEGIVFIFELAKEGCVYTMESLRNLVTNGGRSGYNSIPQSEGNK